MLVSSTVNGKQTTVRAVVRYQLPLLSAKAITLFTGQGLTLSAGIADLATRAFVNKTNRAKKSKRHPAESYVPMSRFRREEDFLILRPFGIESLQLSPPPTLQSFTAELLRKASETEASFAHWKHPAGKLRRDITLSASEVFKQLFGTASNVSADGDNSQAILLGLGGEPTASDSKIPSPAAGEIKRSSTSLATTLTQLFPVHSIAPSHELSAADLEWLDDNATFPAGAGLTTLLGGTQVYL